MEKAPIVERKRREESCPADAGAELPGEPLKGGSLNPACICHENPVPAMSRSQDKNLANLDNFIKLAKEKLWKR